MKNFAGFLFVFFVAFAFAADARFEQADRFVAAGKYKEALAEYRAILASEPHNAKAFYAAGSVRFKMKDYKGALANYQLAYRYDASMKDAYEGAARSFEKLGDAKQAAAERQKIGGKKEAPAAEKKNAPASQTASKDSKSRFSYTSEAFLRAKKAFEAKDFKTACSAAREVLSKEPGNPGAYYYAGAGRYELGEMDKAEYNLKRSFDYPELGFNAHYYLSLIYKKSGKAAEERKELEEYVKLSKNASAVESARARIAELSGKTEKAEPPLAEAPEAPKAETLPEAKPEPSAETAPVAVEPKPESPQKKAAKPGEATVELANEAFLQGDYAGALAQYQELQKRFRDENSRAYILFQIGNIYRVRRDFRSAVAKYRESVELYPNSEWAREAERAWEDAVWQERNADKLPRR